MKIILTQIAAAVIAVVLGLAVAVPAAATEDENAYHVNVGDLLQVTVYGEAQLSGRFRVDAQGAINYPLLGAVVVADLTTEEISQRLRAPASGPPTVEVVEYTSVFVVGEVEKPGAYQFRPGMIAFELVALAGGIRRGTPGTDNSVTALIAAEQELADLRMTRFAQMVQKARVLAEVKGEDFVPSSIAADEPITAAMQQSIIADEQAVFQVRKDALASQKKALEAQRSSYDAEISSLQETIQLHDQEVALMLQEIDGQEALLKKELTVQSKVLALRRELSALKRNALDFRLALARARQRQIEIDQRLVDLGDVRALENANGQRQLDLEIARTAQRIASTTLRLTELQSSIDHPASRILEYSLSRMEQRQIHHNQDQ